MIDVIIFFYRCDYIVDKIRKLLREPDYFL